jgi:xylan 1,4-beta-xylosidase
MITNPILPGFNPDPCICRRGGDYYIAVSSFEWMPGLPVYHSRDLKHWELYTHILTDDTQVDLKKLPSSKGIWAPCLTYDEKRGLFSVVYGIMNSMNARYFDVNNYLITSEDIRGPWSRPVYLHSAGFDASLLTDDDGKKYIVSLEWETREGYEKPGAICLAEYDEKAESITGYPERIWNGGTDRGCIEAPHLYKKNGWYYIMCAEGGTGYNHCVTMGRSRNIRGPYERDPQNPIVTSAPGVSNERANPDHLKPKYYNPDSLLQKSGHGSLVETPSGEAYLVHLCSRPFVPELCCTLGRETAIQKMKWTEDGWLRMADGSNLAKTEVPEPDLPDAPVPQIPEHDDFTSPVLGIQYYAPRQMPSRFADTSSRPGYVRIRGEESRCSLNKVSLLARKLTSLHVQITCEMEFTPDTYQQSAGLILYYDNMDYVYLRKYHSDTLGKSALSVTLLDNGTKTEFVNTRTPVAEAPVYLRLLIDGRSAQFLWSYDRTSFIPIGRTFDTAHFSDEYSTFGEFTGAMVGITCADRVLHKKYADFDFFEYKELS